MKNKFKFLLSFVILLFIFGCKDKSKPVIPVPDYSENYKYFPIKNGREWNYELILVDSIKGTYEITNELSKYNDDSLRMDYYRNGVLHSYAYWTNNNNKLGCCGDAILIDYNMLGCSSDSVLIYHYENSSHKENIYQFCEKKFALDVAKFKTIPCVKTVQLNTYSAGNSLLISNYFGYGVGLIYRQEKSFDKFGKILKIETMKLLSHNF